MTEKELLEEVRRVALGLSLLAFHRRDSRRDAGWSPGLPDVIIVSPAGRGVIYAELKSAGGQLSSDERRWMYALRANGHTCVVWRPADWASGEIRARLQMLAAP